MKEETGTPEPEKKRLSSNKICAVFKKFDTTKDPRSLPKHKRSGLARKHQELAPDLKKRRSNPEESYVEGSITYQKVDTTVKLTRLQRKKIEQQEESTKHLEEIRRRAIKEIDQRFGKQREKQIMITIDKSMSITSKLMELSQNSTRNSKM